MKNSVKTAILITLLVLIMPFDSFAQDQYHNVRTNSVEPISYSSSHSRERYFAISVGSGVSYGGYIGGMISIKPNSSIAIVGSVGEYAGPPLSFGSFDDKTPLTKETQTGMGYSIGIRGYPNPDNWSGYLGIQYINAGTLNYNAQKIDLPGINLVLGGTPLVGNSHLFVDWSINLGFVFKDDVVGGMVGVSLGLGFEL